MNTFYIAKLIISLLCLTTLVCCKDKSETISIAEERETEVLKETVSSKIEQSDNSTIIRRYRAPDGFLRQEVDSESFAYYLRNFPLLNPREKVHLYNGRLKNTQSVHSAILDIDVGEKDLQQCADAVMRLRAEYLFQKQRYGDIAFNFTNGWRFEYEKWRAGNNLVVNGNRTDWAPSATPKESYEDFRTYLNWVFMYAGTLSLSKELTPKKLEDIAIGDVFIYGGSPGHAVLVVDVAVNESTGDKAFLIAQSYMPAQQIHILKNEGNEDISPWYLVSDIGARLNTPEWTFERSALKAF
ncbi:MAG: DUF4846 domain-containing protein [Bacteroidota bacterium]